MDEWTDRLSEYLDGELEAAEATALEAHLAACESCTDTLAELRAVVLRARTLEDTPPATDLWPGTAARLGEAPAGALEAPAAETAERTAQAAASAGDPQTHQGRAQWPSLRRRLSAGPRYSFSVPQLAAAVVLVALSGTAVWLALPGPDAARPPVAGAAPAAPSGRVTLVSSPAAAAPTAGYFAAVAELERVLELGRGRLDTATVRVLEQNLAIIDQAIADTRRALAQDPASAYLNAHLAGSMRRKIELLRQATTLART
ncbi:MAG: zf-HC2 domain-containing protein [Gemmatimonadetes bacterium]|nr:zf-HC2 domain-containing protein [Gemmatimonadota bacterium]